MSKVSTKESSIQSMMAQQHFDTLGFSANPKKEKFRRVRTSRDGLMTVTFTAPVTCGVKEMKCSFDLVRHCIKDTAELKEINDRKVLVTISLRDMAKFITGRTTINERKGVFDSLARVSDMNIRVVKKPAAPETNQQIKDICTRWIYELKTLDSYETATVEVSIGLINIIKANGIGYNLGRLMQFNGRAALLYAFLQGYKFKSDNGSYGYQHYIEHERIVEGIDIESIKDEKKQIREIRNAFKIIGLNYSFNRRKDRWEKGKEKVK